MVSNVHEAVSRRTKTLQECGNLAQVVQRIDENIGKLNRLIYHDLIKHGKAKVSNDQLKASRCAFFWHQRKIKLLRSELREAKLSLLVSVGALTL